MGSAGIWQLRLFLGLWEDSRRNGTGNLTNGELDTNAVGSKTTAQSFTRTYSIGADDRGVMNLNIGGNPGTLAFAMMANGNAQFISSTPPAGQERSARGPWKKADTTALARPE